MIVVVIVLNTTVVSTAATTTIIDIGLRIIIIIMVTIVIITVLVGGETPWEVNALPGPNAEPDYFTPEDIATFYSSTYKVHYNS